MPPVLRPFAKRDLEPSFDLWARSWSSALAEFDPAQQLPAWRRIFLEETLAKRVVMAATIEPDGPLAGFAVVDLGAAHLDQLVVEPDLARHGCGRALCRFAESLLPGRRMRLRVVQSNAGAVAFYERLGYERIGPTVSPSGWQSWIYASPGT